MLKLKSLNYQIGTFQEHEFNPAQTPSGEWILGRAAACDLILSAPEVSRVHGRIKYDGGQYFFSDLGSTDGSRINHEQIEINQKYPLKQDDIIRIGDFVLAIESLESFSPPEEKTLSGRHQIQQWTEDLTVRCTRIIQETQDVKTFCFVADPPQLFAYQPGQFVTLKLEIDGKPVQRAYSISSSPSRPHTLDITIKRVPAPADSPDVPPGLVSNWLHDRFAVGDEIQLCGGPMGHFTCATNSAPKLLMISAGSGITPMLSMSKWLYDTAQDRDVVFCHSARSPQDIVAFKELELMANHQPHFRLAITMTRLELSSSWPGYTGRLNDALLSHLAPDFKERVVYVCGPEPFTKGVKDMLSNLDFPMENYNEESFGGAKRKAKAPAPAPAPAPVPTPAPSSPKPSNDVPTSPAAPASSQPVVVFSETKEEVSCSEEESILEIAQENGVEIRGGCLQGVCGMCKKRKREGEIRYDAEPSALSSDEQQEGYILPCIAFPVGKVVVEA